MVRHLYHMLAKPIRAHHHRPCCVHCRSSQGKIWCLQVLAWNPALDRTTKTLQRLLCVPELVLIVDDSPAAWAQVIDAIGYLTTCKRVTCMHSPHSCARPSTPTRSFLIWSIRPFDSHPFLSVRSICRTSSSLTVSSGHLPIVPFPASRIISKQSTMRFSIGRHHHRCRRSLHCCHPPARRLAARSRLSQRALRNLNLRRRALPRVAQPPRWRFQPLPQMTKPKPWLFLLPRRIHQRSPSRPPVWRWGFEAQVPKRAARQATTRVE